MRLVLPTLFVALLSLIAALASLLLLAASPTQLGLQSGRLDLSSRAQLAPEAVAAYPVAADPDALTADISPELNPGGSSIAHEVAPSENLSLIFENLGLRASDLANILIADRDRARALNTVRPGNKLEFHLDAEGELRQFDYHFSSTRFTRYSKRDDNRRFVVSQHSPDFDRLPRFHQGTIGLSLYTDALASGMSANKIMELAEIFAYDIDFAYQLRPGDTFRLLYDQLYQNGEVVDDGPILLAEFEISGETLTAIRYVDADGKAAYFTPEGKAMKTRFLRMPMAFGRISSGFSLARKHPILNVVRKHTGVDYAAPYGTEVFSVGNGKISKKAFLNGYGNTVIVDHGDGYTTLYAHLSRFARIREGTRVRQGQVIGYVGSTGLSTGPHLHYEFRIGGQHMNPQKVKLPRASKLKQAQLPEFLRVAQAMRERADIYKRVAAVGGEQSAVSLP